ncbi:ABC transporter ATP-binding protein [Fibrobacter sp. UWH1]|uniref:ABC transporter ATP-binding protein n=1 Tax=Fibrobacter sp. UWH1 TaxID=1964354 RepID=UPI000B5220EF|nr:ABC transporter ATP-binding protein [Fibrobacter sp. UWH1]OWV03939.1 multidrug ABC transporter permease [Fibrobacter sp. UWH1]
MKKQNSLSILFDFAAEKKSNLIASLIIAVVGVLAGTIPYYSTAQLLNGFYNHSVTANFILIWGLVGIGGYIVKILLSTISTIISHVATFEILKNIRIRLTHKMERIPMGIMLDKASGSYKMLVIETVQKIEKPLAHMVPEMAANTFTPIVIVVILFVIDWRMALGAIATIPIGFIVTMGQMIGYKEKSSRYFKANADMNDAIIEYVNGIEVIKAFNQGTSSFSKFSRACTYYRDTTLDWWKNCWMFSAAGLSLVSATLLVTLPLGAYLFMNGEITFASFLTCAILSMGISSPILATMSYAESFSNVFQALKQIDDFLNEKDLVRPTEETKLNGNVFEFKNVSFGYKEKLVLKDISFKTVESGVTAIVGPSGSGKSTIAKLMAGFWDVSQGEILLGGTPLTKIPFKQQMDKISYVAQDNYLFNCSIKENIRMGRPTATDEEIYEAAKSAGCHEFITKLENGYNTLVGDAGGKLSGGERQRITIARAILKNADIIILDEATAYADPENEAEIQKALEKLVKDKVLIIIAHRLSTIKNAQNILVIDDGKLSCQGTHDMLMQNSPLYKNMWEKHIAATEK